MSAVGAPPDSGDRPTAVRGPGRSGSGDTHPAGEPLTGRAGPGDAAPPARAGPGEATPPARPWVRVLTFAVLTLYGLVRWSTLLSPAPMGRLLGVFALATALAGAVPLMRRRIGTPPATLAAAGLILLAFPMAGVRWHDFVQLKIAVGADEIGTGIQGLPDALVPYLGPSDAIRLVVVLGAAVLALDAAAVMAFAPVSLRDGRRAAAAVPLLALAIVPGTLVRPEFPYLQGLLLFVLLAAFLWGERVRRDGVVSALVVAVLAGVVATIVAPRIDTHRPWFDYRAWAGQLVVVHVDRFDWNQTYGPLIWPRSGDQVLTVRAQTGDYWKAEDLDSFDGTDWVAGTSTITPSLPSPSESALSRWSQSITVTIDGMRTDEIIAAGYASQPSPVPGGFAVGSDAGTWIAGRELGPGTTYSLTTYSPRPSAAELAASSSGYPDALLGGYRTLRIPVAHRPVGVDPQVVFPPFHSRKPPALYEPSAFPDATSLLRASPYGRVYALARRLAAAAPTPYAFVESVMRYLSPARGFRYDLDPPAARYPLVSFLFSSKQGYCQQYSGAMALLLRMGGVPVRVAAGFTPGLRAAGDRWVVTDSDAHAWDEVWFPLYGWVRFDPTPPTSVTGVTPLNAFPTTSLSKQDAAAAVGASHHGLGAGATRPRSAPRAAGGGVGPWSIAAAVVLVILLAALAWSLRGRRASPEAELSELERAMARSGRPLRDGVTLASLEGRFSASPEAAGYIRALRIARYGGGAGAPSLAQRRALRRELGRGLGPGGRARALWALPPRPRRRR